MASKINAIMELCCEVSKNKTMKDCLKTGAMVTGSAAAAGGLLFGPPGFFIGGAVGGALSWWLTNGQFKPIPQLIQQLSPGEKRKLYSDVMAVLGTISWMDVADLITLVMANSNLKWKVQQTTLNFLNNKLKADQSLKQ